MTPDTVWHDLRHGLRTWRSHPSVYATAVAALALGIGANTTIFSVVQTVLLRPLPYKDADRLVDLFAKSPKKNIQRYFLSSSDYFDLAEQSHTLYKFAGYWRNEMNITDTGLEPERVAGVSVTPFLISTLGIQPAAGRELGEGEGKVGAPDGAIITTELWLRRYGGNPSIVALRLRQQLWNSVTSRSPVSRLRMSRLPAALMC